VRVTAGAILAALAAAGAAASDKPWTGPGRFCGYATVIDLLPAESIGERELGIHGAQYLWISDRGAVRIQEINWAAEPRPVARRLGTVNDAELVALGRKSKLGRYALWNGDHLAAYFTSSAVRSDTDALHIARRLMLVDHAGAKGEGCKYRILFSWD
jgi:hypothetical protein